MSQVPSGIGSSEESTQIINIQAVTWLKESHSLFDYQSNKNTISASFKVPTSAKFVFLYRNSKASEVSIKEGQKLQEPPQGAPGQLLGCFEIIRSLSTPQSSSKSIFLKFYHTSQITEAKHRDQALETDGSIQSEEYIPEDVYIIVRSLKNKQSGDIGYKLGTGQTLKLGRVEYQVISIAASSSKSFRNPVSASSFRPSIPNAYFNDRVMECSRAIRVEDQSCKYCLGTEEKELGWLVTPCKCSGSTRLVHVVCLERWIQSKVTAQNLSVGTMCYNFEKFCCELCTTEFPRYLKFAESSMELKEDLPPMVELMPIKFPEGEHLVLSGACEKAKNLIVVQNVPATGLKIGRSHDCELRVNDISVSRVHAKIMKQGPDYYIFDMKSKFGTLVRQEQLVLQITDTKKGIQIGRTIFIFELNSKIDVR